jgi:hypothetical protein
MELTLLPGFRPTSEWFPGRYIAIPGVINRITCRHRRNQRCDCDSRRPEASAPQQPPPPPPGLGPTVALAEINYFLDLIWCAVSEAVHNFPDAQAAVNEVLARYPRTYPGPAARDPPFP